MRQHPILFSPEMVLALMAGRKSMTRRVISYRNSLVDGSMVSEKVWNQYDFDFSSPWIDKGPSPAGNAGPYLKVPSRLLDTVHRIYPKFQPDDYLFVRENWKLKAWNFEDSEATFEYAAGIRETLDFNDKEGYELADVAEWIMKQLFKMEAKGIMRPVAGQDEESEEDIVYEFTGKNHPFSPGIHLPKWGSRIWLQVASTKPEKLLEINKEDAISEGLEQIDIMGSTGYKCYGPKNLIGHSDPRAAFKSLWQSINGPESWEQNVWVWATQFTKTSKP